MRYQITRACGHTDIVEINVKGRKCDDRIERERAKICPLCSAQENRNTTK